MIANGKNFEQFMKYHANRFDVNDFQESIMDCFNSNILKPVWVLSSKTLFQPKNFAQMWFFDAVKMFYSQKGKTLFSELDFLQDENGNAIVYKTKDELDVNEVWRPSKKCKVYESEETMRHLADVFDSVTKCADDLCKLNGEWGHENVLYEFVPNVTKQEDFSSR